MKAANGWKIEEKKSNELAKRSERYKSYGLKSKFSFIKTLAMFTQGYNFFFIVLANFRFHCIKRHHLCCYSYKSVIFYVFS